MLAALTLLLAYLIGSVTFSYVVGKALKGIDVREHGSGNAGATNTLRILGWGPALLVLALDIGKGVLAVWIGKWVSGGTEWLPALTGLMAVLGHNWPVFFRFRGGKGIATTIGVMATMALVPSLAAGVAAIAAIAVTRYVSVGSLLYTALLPFLLWGMHYPGVVLASSCVISVLAWLRHRSNIVKLVQGTENRIGKKA